MTSAASLDFSSLVTSRQAALCVAPSRALPNPMAMQAVSGRVIVVALVCAGEGTELKENVVAARIGESGFVQYESLEAERVAELILVLVHGVAQVDRKDS